MKSRPYHTLTEAAPIQFKIGLKQIDKVPIFGRLEANCGDNAENH